MTPPRPPPSLSAQLRPRLAAHALLKAVLIPLFMTGFFVAYFHLLKRPASQVTIMPVTALDALIDFHPTAIGVYVSLWFYVLLAPATLRGWREIRLYCLGVALLTCVGFGAFRFWPTATPAARVDWAHYPSFRFLETIDASGNACPSLHVAFAVFTALWLERLLRQIGARATLRALNAAWCLAIVYSTLATKQHVAIDVAVGAALGAVGGLFDPRPRR